VPQTLLLADDSVTIQRVIELTFADEAIRVVAVSDGDQAIQRIEADPPDIVLVDIGMPGRTGYEVAQHIKQSPRLKHIPVLLLTGAFEPVDQVKAAAAGCDGVLAKPFEPQLVIARVKELLLRGGREAASSAPAGDRAEPSLSPASPASPASAASSGSVFESWGTPHAGPEAKSPPSATQVARLDDYFDQLDAAFQTLGGNARTEPPKVPATSPVAAIFDWFGGPSARSEPAPDLSLSTEAPEPEAEPERESEPEPEHSPDAWHTQDSGRTADIGHTPDIGHTQDSERTLDTEHSLDSKPTPDTEHIPDTWADAREPASPRFVSKPASKTPTIARMPEPSSPATLPKIADAFAVILAAEQHEPMPAVWPGWPPPQPPSNGGGAPSEDAIEEITRRVLERLSDRVVRETVESVISSIAERLVREEIDRIKSSIK
jgi:CheY-like chemotaxis protein